MKHYNNFTLFHCDLLLLMFPEKARLYSELIAIWFANLHTTENAKNNIQIVSLGLVRSQLRINQERLTTCFYLALLSLSICSQYLIEGSNRYSVLALNPA